MSTLYRKQPSSRTSSMLGSHRKRFQVPTAIPVAVSACFGECWVKEAAGQRPQIFA